MKLIFFIVTLLTFALIISEGSLLDNLNQIIKILISILGFGILVQIKAEKNSVRYSIGIGIIWATLLSILIGFIFFVYVFFNFPG
jgi:hypothetical protein